MLNVLIGFFCQLYIYAVSTAVYIFIISFLRYPRFNLQLSRDRNAIHNQRLRNIAATFIAQYQRKCLNRKVEALRSVCIFLSNYAERPVPSRKYRQRIE